MWFHIFVCNDFAAKVLINMTKENKTFLLILKKKQKKLLSFILFKILFLSFRTLFVEKLSFNHLGIS